MNRLRILCALMLLVVPILQVGCRTSQTPKSEFPALSTPVSYRPPPKAPPGVLGKTKDVALGTVKYVAAGVILLSFWVLKSALKGDDDDDKSGFDPDPLWRQGYGFNNPNNERIRNGQPVLNFDGTVAK